VLSERSQVFLLLSLFERMSLKFDFRTFCDLAANGRLPDVLRVLESGELDVNGEAHVALALAAANGHVDVVDCLLRNAMFDPSADGNRAFWLAAGNATVTSWSWNDCCETSASTRRHLSTTPFDWLLNAATSRWSNDCCKTSASIRRPTTTTRSEVLLTTAT
jgi:hypothetical protein